MRLSSFWLLDVVNDLSDGVINSLREGGGRHRPYLLALGTWGMGRGRYRSLRWGCDIPEVLISEES